MPTETQKPLTASQKAQLEMRRIRLDNSLSDEERGRRLSAARRENLRQFDLERAGQAEVERAKALRDIDRQLAASAPKPTATVPTVKPPPAKAKSVREVYESMPPGPARSAFLAKHRQEILG